MERAAIPRKVAMSISGHETEHVYRRYDIVAERDLSDASTRMDQFFASMQEQSEKKAEKASANSLGTLSGTPENSASTEMRESAPAEDPKLKL